jgi:hypothetical protein
MPQAYIFIVYCGPWLAFMLALRFQTLAILWFSGISKQSVVLNSQAFIDATECAKSQPHVMKHSPSAALTRCDDEEVHCRWRPDHDES